MSSYKPGSWWAICDSCGLKFRSEELRERWDGLMVCDKDWETRHPQDFVRPKGEKITPPWIRVDDTASLITTYTSGPLTWTASANDTIRYVDTTSGGFTLTLPNANAAAFNGAQIMLLVFNSGTANNLTLATASNFRGSTTVAAGDTARLQNNSVTNTWTRL